MYNPMAPYPPIEGVNSRVLLAVFKISVNWSRCVVDVVTFVDGAGHLLQQREFDQI